MIYYLAHNGNDVFNYGTITQGQKIESMQPILKFFNTIEELDSELSLYGRKIDDVISEISGDVLSDLPSIEP
jgi:hypothetical protein